jgi:hypothetical protein
MGAVIVVGMVVMRMVMGGRSLVTVVSVAMGVVVVGVMAVMTVGRGLDRRMAMVTGRIRCGMVVMSRGRRGGVIMMGGIVVAGIVMTVVM